MDANPDKNDFSKLKKLLVPQPRPRAAPLPERAELRAAAGVSSGPLACAMDDGFPSRSVGGTARKQALDAWLRAAAKACTTRSC